MAVTEVQLPPKNLNISTRPIQSLADADRTINEMIQRYDEVYRILREYTENGLANAKIISPVDENGNVLVNPIDRNAEIPLGNITGITGIDKYGRSTNVDSGVATDIWDGANSTDDIDIWVAPTQARVHDLSSSDANDTSGGTGARTVSITGLTTWSDDGATTETIIMNGTSSVATSNSYVIIYRMEVITFGSAGPNVGQIEAVAQTDATKTAIILADAGQTQMAIFGIPSTQILLMDSFYASILRANLVTTASQADLQLLYARDPENNPSAFTVKHTLGIDNRGDSPTQHMFRPYKRFDGPGIIKLQATGSANDLDVSGGFDAEIRDIT